MLIHRSISFYSDLFIHPELPGLSQARLYTHFSISANSFSAGVLLITPVHENPHQQAGGVRLSYSFKSRKKTSAKNKFKRKRSIIEQANLSTVSVSKKVYFKKTLFQKIN